MKCTDIKNISKYPPLYFQSYLLTHEICIHVGLIPMRVSYLLCYLSLSMFMFSVFQWRDKNVWILSSLYLVILITRVNYKCQYYYYHLLNKLSLSYFLHCSVITEYVRKFFFFLIIIVIFVVELSVVTIVLCHNFFFFYNNDYGNVIAVSLLGLLLLLNEA